MLKICPCLVKQSIQKHQYVTKTWTMQQNNNDMTLHAKENAFSKPKQCIKMIDHWNHTRCCRQRQSSGHQEKTLPGKNLPTLIITLLWGTIKSLKSLKNNTHCIVLILIFFFQEKASKLCYRIFFFSKHMHTINKNFKNSSQLQKLQLSDNVKK